MEGFELPILTAPRDLLKEGPTTLRAQQGFIHPVQKIQKEAFSQGLAQTKVLSANTFGSHIAMQMDMEEAILARCKRPFLPNALPGLETLLNMDEDIDFSDFMAAPEMQPTRRIEGPQAYDN